MFTRKDQIEYFVLIFYCKNKLIVTFKCIFPLENDLLLYFPSQIDFLIQNYLLQQHCQLFHNHLLISVPASRVIIAEETPDPSFVIKIRRQEIVAKAAPATATLLSHLAKD